MTTALSELPIDPSISQSNNNITLTTNDKNSQMNSQMNNQMNSQMNNQINNQNTINKNVMNQETANELINGLQSAAANGATSLPAASIPTTTTHLVKDNEATANFVPETNNNNYIDEYISNENVETDIIKEKNRKESLEVIFKELQGPILVGLIYFIFQLPASKNFLIKYAPALFISDGNMGLSGFITTSLLFGGLYYVINNIINNLSLQI